jgi:predicted MFS family arabinose efflux permease
LSFLVSAALVAMLRTRFSAVRPEATDGRSDGLWAGFAVIVRDPTLRALTAVWTILFLTIDIALVADLPLARSFGWGAFGYGLMNSAFGAGALLGSVAARKLTPRLESWAVLLEVLGVGFGYVLTGLAPVFGAVLAGQIIAASTDAVGEVGGTSIVQRNSADEVRGRIFGAIVTCGLIANAVGFTFAGFLVQLLGPRGLYVLLGVASFLAAPLLLPLLRGESPLMDLLPSPTTTEVVEVPEREAT